MSEELSDNLLGSTQTMHFTLDDKGQWSKDKNYTTIGSKVSVEGTITDPEGPTWEVIVKSSAGNYKKDKTGVATGDTLSFKVPTNLGSTKLTLKVWSERGSEDAGIKGSIKLQV